MLASLKTPSGMANGSGRGNGAMKNQIRGKKENTTNQSHLILFGVARHGKQLRVMIKPKRGDSSGKIANTLQWSNFIIP
jgi:hypothetical protein